MLLETISQNNWVNLDLAMNTNLTSVLIYLSIIYQLSIYYLSNIYLLSIYYLSIIYQLLLYIYYLSINCCIYVYNHLFFHLWIYVLAKDILSQKNATQIINPFLNSITQPKSQPTMIGRDFSQSWNPYTPYCFSSVHRISYYIYFSILISEKNI